MSELVIFVAIGLALLVLLLLWVQRSVGSAGSARELAGARDALADLQLDLPPQALVERIFSSQDSDFVSRHALPPVQRIFLQERKVVALAWLRHTRKKVEQIMDFHRRTVRRHISLSPAFEVKLAINYMLFLLMCGILLCLIWLSGPFRVWRMVGYAAAVAEQLSLILGRLLAGLDSALFGKIKIDWTYRSAAS